MSPSKSKKKPANKASARATTARSQGSTAAGRAPQKKAAGKAAAGKSSARKTANKATPLAAKKDAGKSRAAPNIKAKDVAAKNSAARNAPPNSAPVKEVAAKSAATEKAATKHTQTPKVTKVSSAKPSVAPRTEVVAKRPVPVARPVAVKPTERKPAAPMRKPAAKHQQTVSPNVARQHFLEILKAKQERVRQGPAYPPANAFTGQRDGAGATEPSAPGDETAAPESTEPTATFDGPEQPHGRGNQGVRPQK